MTTAMDTPTDPHPGPDTAAARHRRAWDAIPWVLAGAAGEADERCVREHLAHCAECRAEWDWQRQIQSGLEAGLPARFPPADAGLQRLLARLDDAADRPASAAPAASAAAANAPNGWTRWLVAAVLVQAVALGASGLAWLQARPAAPMLATAPADFSTLSRPGPAPTAASGPATLRLVPAPGLDFASLQALLAQHALVVVDAAPDGQHLGLAAADGSRASARAALAPLRAHPGVRMAEPTAAGLGEGP